MRHARFLIALAFAVAACGGGEKTLAPETVPFAGNYTLQTVNGQKLPYVVLQQGQNSITLLEDHLTVTDGGTWSETEVYRVVNNGTTSNQTGSSSGSWVRSGTSLGFYDASGQTVYSGSFSSNRLDLSNSLGMQVYTK